MVASTSAAEAGESAIPRPLRAGDATTGKRNGKVAIVTGAARGRADARRLGALGAAVAGLGPSRDGGYAHYGAAKAAVAHYVRYLAQDLGEHGITANGIARGFIMTGRIVATVLSNRSDANANFAAMVALRRLGTVADCAKVVEFLTTDRSDCISGTVIAIDGGPVRWA